MKIKSSGMRYYSPVKNWQKIKRHLGNEEVNRILYEEFNKFTYGSWGQTFVKGQLPWEFEGCDWQVERIGRPPGYWKYVKHAACHWLVNFNLALANLVEPKRPWRIITSVKHSSVWDGDKMLFDFNFSAFEVPAEKTFEMAHKRVLPVGTYLEVGYPAKARRPRNKRTPKSDVAVAEVKLEA